MAEQNPYVGAKPFEAWEKHLFFGRDREAFDLLSLVISNGLVLFYAQSGAGKSSLINTKLIPGLLEEGEFQVFPVGRVRRDEVVGSSADNIYVYNLLTSLSKQKVDESILAHLSLSDYLKHMDFNEKDGYFYNERSNGNIFTRNDFKSFKYVLVIDQFEELFTTYEEKWQSREDFFNQLATALKDFARLWVVLVMREDYIAYLDPYVYLLPGRLRTRYYMQRLSTNQAEKAIEGPAEKRGREYAPGAAKTLVNALSQVNVRRPDNTWAPQPGQYVEPVQLQVVCSSLWQKLEKNEKLISNDRVTDHVKNINQALGNFYAERVETVAKKQKVAQREIREWFEKQLIIDGKRRNMVAQQPGGKSGGLDDRVVREFLGNLVREEKRGGGATFYELTHDSLVGPIVENNQKWDSENRSPFRSQAETWKKTGNEIHLLNDQNLIDAKQWAEENQDKLIVAEQDFLVASQIQQNKIEEERELEFQRQEQERRNQQQKLRAAQELAEVQTLAAKKAKQYTAISLGLAIIAIIATIFALIQLNNTNEQRNIALKAVADAKAAEADANEQEKFARASELSAIALDRSNSQLDLAILLGLQADSIDSNPRTQNTLLAIQQKSSRFSRILKVEEEEEDILELKYSPNGEIFASRNRDGITFWDANTLEKLNTPLNGHFRRVTALAVSWDGKFMASGASDGTIVIWDVSKQQELSKPFKAHNGEVSKLAFSKDGQILASTSSSESSIILWDITDPSNPKKDGSALSWKGQTILSLVFSPDGNTIAGSGYDGSIILWDLNTHESIGDPLTEHTGWVNDLAFNSTGTVLASAGNDYKVVLWNLEDLSDPANIGEILYEEFFYIQSVAINPSDNNVLAAGISDGSIDLWNISDPENPTIIAEKFNKGSSSNANLSFNHEGDLLVSNSSYGGSVILWDVKNPDDPRKLSDLTIGRSSFANNAVFVEDGKAVVTSNSDSTIVYWDITQPENPQKIGHPLQGHPGQPSGMDFSSDGSLLASHGEDGTILLDVNTQEQIGVGNFYSSRDESILAYQFLDKTTDENFIYFRDGTSGASIGAPISGQYQTISPDGTRLIFSTYEKDGKIHYHLWNIKANEEEFSFVSSYYPNPNFSPDSNILMYQTYDQETNQSYLSLWDIVEAGKVGADIKGTFSTFSPDSQTMVYQNTDPVTYQTLLSLLDTDTANIILKDVQGTFLAFNSDNGALIYQTIDSTSGETLIKLWEIGNAAELKSFAGYNPIVSQDRSTLAFVSYDGSKINLIDTSTGEDLILPVEGYSISSLSANGKIILYSSTDYYGDSMIALNTQTGERLFSHQNSYLNNVKELGQVIVYELINNTDGVSNIFGINTETGQKINEPLNGNFISLTPDGETLVYQLGGSYNILDMTSGAKIGEPILGSYMTIRGDGKILVTRTGNKTINFWDVTKTWPFGEPIPDTPNRVSTATLSQKGDTLSWVDEEGISLLNITSGNLIAHPFMNHYEYIDFISVSFSPNGKILAIQNYEDYSTTLWDVTSGKFIGQPMDGVLATFSPDSKLLSTVNPDSERGVIIWDLTDLENPEPVIDHIPGFFALFSPDNRMVVFGGDFENQTLKIWDLTTHNLINDSIPGSFATFSPDSKMLAVFNLFEEVETVIWDLTTLKTIGDPFPGGGFVIFSPDGKSLAVGDSKNSTVLWDLTTHEPISDPIPGNIPIRFSEDGNILIFNEEDTAVMLWDISTHKQIGDPVKRDDIGDFLFLPFAGTSSNGDIYAFFDNDNNILLLDVETNTYINPPEYPGEILGINLNQNGIFLTQNNFVPSPDTDILAIYGNQGLLLWDLKRNKALGNLIPLGSLIPATNVIVSPNSKMVASFAEDGIVIRDIVTDADTHLEYSGRLTSNMIFSADSTRLIALDDDNIVISWDTENGESTISDEQPLKELSIARSIFSPDGKYLVYESSKDNNISLHVWDIVAGKRYLEGPIELGNFGGAITFSQDGALMAYNDGEKIVLYKIQTKEQLGTLSTGINDISNLNIILENNTVKYIITVDLSGFTQIWDWATRTKISDPISGDLQIVGSSAQKHMVIYIDSSGRLIKWDWELDHRDWREIFCPLAHRNFTHEEWKVYFSGEQYPNLKGERTCPNFPAGQ